VLLTIVSLLYGSVVPGRVTLRICRVAVQYAIKHGLWHDMTLVITRFTNK